MRHVTRTALAALLATTVASARVAAAEVEATPDVVVKAAYLYNFARFTDWQTLDPSAPLVLCVLGDAGIARALSDAAHGQDVGGHRLTVINLTAQAFVRTCHVLFISRTATRQAAATLDALKSLPILTVSDGKDFARSTGIVELFVDDGGRMRFAINTDAVSRAGLRLSSRLLGLARIVRDGHVQ
jgi:YfiR/HmsC-like